jgi:two-component system, NtrC family, sensor kinase
MPGQRKRSAATLERDNAALEREVAALRRRQAASAEIHQAIANAPGAAEPVLAVIAKTTASLFGTSAVVIGLSDGNALCEVIRIGQAASRVGDAMSHLPGLAGLPKVVIDENRQVHIPDLDDPPPAMADWPGLPSARAAGTRTMVGTPLRRAGRAIGFLTVHRDEKRPFGDDELALLQSFADQAVIAIENARLLTELNARNRDLAEALDQQTATSEILRAIASSPGDEKRVLDTICETSMKMFGAANVGIRRIEGEMLRYAGSAGSGLAEMRATFAEVPLSWLSRRTFITVPILNRKQLHVPDLDNADPEDEYSRENADIVALSRQAGNRTAAFTPLLCEGQAIGVMIVNRAEPRPFSDKELATMTGFADQAVIAIENARLLAELRESLDRRTAIAEVLQVISASPGELQPVFEAMLESAVRLCDASNGSVFQIEGDLFRRATSVNLPSELVAHGELRFAPGLPASRMLASKSTVHMVDVLAELAERPDHATLRIAAERSGARSALWVPMVKDDEVVAAFVLARNEVRAFTEAQIGLVENFASQAVIAIENARLLGELRTARDAAERALGELRAAQANLIQAEKMASLGQLTAGIAHEIKNPLNFVNNFAGLSVELLDELKDATASALDVLGHDKRGEIDEVVRMLTSNLEKIAEHGGRADGIVKSMLAHSRGGSGERQAVNLNNLVEESLNLAYHGARAQDQTFNITLERDLDPSLAPIEVVPQDLTRVFLNLFGNGFYAANKRRKETGDPDFSPVLKVTTRNLDRDVLIRIRDNGVGIPPEIRAKLFEPFFTTKPTGEGTGLGLSISYEIVTRQHGGAISVESEPGAFTEFRVTIPKLFGAAATIEGTTGRATS